MNLQKGIIVVVLLAGLATQATKCFGVVLAANALDHDGNLRLFNGAVHEQFSSPWPRESFLTRLLVDDKQQFVRTERGSMAALTDVDFFQDQPNEQFHTLSPTGVTLVELGEPSEPTFVSVAENGVPAAKCNIFVSYNVYLPGSDLVIGRGMEVAQVVAESGFFAEDGTTKTCVDSEKLKETAGSYQVIGSESKVDNLCEGPYQQVCQLDISVDPLTGLKLADIKVSEAPELPHEQPGTAE